MQSKNIGLVWAVLITFLVLEVGCASPSSPAAPTSPTSTTTPSAVLSGSATKGITSVFVSTKIIQYSPAADKSASSRTTNSNTVSASFLSFVNSSGVDSPYIFKTSTGGQAVAELESPIVQISNNFIAFQFSNVDYVVTNSDGSLTITDTVSTSTAVDGTGVVNPSAAPVTALLNIKSGAVYDISGYNLTAPGSTIVSGNYLYTTKGAGSTASIYKIDLNNLTSAVPISNGQFTDPGWLEFCTTNSKLITTTASFDTNGVLPPKAVLSCPLPGSGTISQVSSFQGVPALLSHAANAVQINLTPVPVLIDAQGNAWTYCIDWFYGGMGSAPTPTGRYCVYQLGIDDNGQTSVSNYSEGQLAVGDNTVLNGIGNFSSLSTYDVQRQHVSPHSLVTVTLSPELGPVLTSVAFTLPTTLASFVGSKNYGPGEYFNNDPNKYSLGESGAPPLVYAYNNELFWGVGMSLYSTPLSAGNSVSTLYSSPNLITQITGSNQYSVPAYGLSNGSLTFYQYINSSTVGTYCLPIGQSVPVLMDSSQDNIQGIVQINF